MQSDQRFTDRLINHWRRRKGVHTMPIYEQFAPEALGEDVWQNCCAFLVQKSAQRWIYINDYVGDKAQIAIGKDITGEVLTLTGSDLKAVRIMEKAAEVMRIIDPLSDEGHFINENAKIIKFRSCLMPFGRENQITHLVVGISWRMFS